MFNSLDIELIILSLKARPVLDVGSRVDGSAASVLVFFWIILEGQPTDDLATYGRVVSNLTGLTLSRSSHREQRCHLTLGSGTMWEKRRVALM